MAPSATLTAFTSGRADTRATGRDDERHFDLPLEHGTRAPAAARHAAHGVLAGWGVEAEHLHDVMLVVSELVTNAVAHALPPVVLHLTLATGGAGLRVCVTDGGPAQEPATWASRRPVEEHGRGTDVVSTLTDTGGTSVDAEGLIDHWADLRTD